MVSWAVELTKEEGKRDYDAMAKLLKDYEQPAEERKEDNGSTSAVNWAIDRIRSISPTINSAEGKLNRVKDSVKCWKGNL